AASSRRLWNRSELGFWLAIRQLVFQLTSLFIAEASEMSRHLDRHVIGRLHHSLGGVTPCPAQSRGVRMQMRARVESDPFVLGEAEVLEHGRGDAADFVVVALGRLVERLLPHVAIAIRPAA